MQALVSAILRRELILSSFCMLSTISTINVMWSRVPALMSLAATGVNSRISSHLIDKWNEAMLFDVQRSASKPAATNRDFRAKSSVRWYVEQELLKSGGTWENHELHHLPQVRKRNNATVGPNKDHFRAKFATGVSISIFLPVLSTQYLPAPCITILWTLWGH